MGIRLTGISTPIGGIEWEYTEKNRLPSVGGIISPKEKIKVFISSICGEEKYDTVRVKLSAAIESTGLASVYLFESSGAATVSAQDLQEKGARRLRSDKPFKWSAVLVILQNEAYVGDRLIQKAPPQNFLTKKPDPTEAYDSRYIRDDHEAIVSGELWERAQSRLKKEKEERDSGINVRATCHFLYGKVFCPVCGEPYRRYTARRGNKESYKTWRCRGHANGSGCRNRHIEETELLQGIADELSTDVETLSAETVACVERITVEDIRVTVVLREKQESA